VITVYLFTIVKLLSAKFNGKFPILMKKFKNPPVLFFIEDFAIIWNRKWRKI